MLKSTNLVITLAYLLGAAVLILPTRSYATTMIDAGVAVESRVEVDGVLSFEVEDRQVAADNPNDPYHDGASQSNNIYYATLFPGMDYSSDELMTTTYRVACNYINDSDDSCDHGWNVSAAATSNHRDNGYATMNPSTVSAPKINSNGANALDGSVANWLMKLSSDDVKTLNGTNYATPTIVLSSNAASGSVSGIFVTVPATPTTVVRGDSIVQVNGIKYYLGARTFKVTYGFSVAANTRADTYTGEVEYVLSLNAS